MPHAELTDADLLAALRDCYPAGLTKNLVEAGLLLSAALAVDSEAPDAGIPGNPPRYAVQITLRSPSSDDAANAQLAAQVENRLLGHPAISRVSLQLRPPLFPIL